VPIEISMDCAWNMARQVNFTPFLRLHQVEAAIDDAAIVLLDESPQLRDGNQCFISGHGA
jgi:hypothetical protein